MPHMVYFFRHHHKSLSYISSLEAFRSRVWRHRPSESEKFNLVDPALNNPRLNTDVLGTVQGEGRFMKTVDLDQITDSDWTQDSAAEKGLWTRQEVLEQWVRDVGKVEYERRDMSYWRGVWGEIFKSKLAVGKRAWSKGETNRGGVQTCKVSLNESDQH